MKVAFILPSLLNRGPIVFTRYLVNGLLKQGVDVKVFYLKEQQELEFNCRCEKLNFFSSHQLDEFDIVHTTMLRPDVFGMLHKKALGKRWIVAMHNEISMDLKFLYTGFKARVLEILWRIALNSAMNIITSSQAQLIYYKKMVGTNKNFKVIGYGIEKRHSQPLAESDAFVLENLRKNFKIIGACGLLIRRKGFDQLVEILVQQSHLAVVLIGDGECENELRARAESLGVTDRLCFLGFRKNHIDFYKYFDAYALTSHSEGFGLAMIEAMSHGLPIICSDLDIYKGYFDSSHVNLFNPGDISSLNLAIHNALNHKDYFSNKSLNLFVNKFSSEIMAENHIQYYKSIIG